MKVIQNIATTMSVIGTLSLMLFALKTSLELGLLLIHHLFFPINSAQFLPSCELSHERNNYQTPRQPCWI